MTSSSSSAGTLAQLVKPEYRNWLALGHALTTELRHGLQSFIKREIETFYKNVTTSLAHVVAPCTCGFVAKRRPNQYHDMVKCDWAKTLQAYHDKNKPNWKQSDSSKWLDPALGPWEIAKLYLPDLGGHAVTSEEDMDITSMLNLIFWCTHFAVPPHLVQDVREIRNKKWAHATSLELSDADKKMAFNAIENLLRDPNLAHEPDAQNALKEIVKLKSVSDLHSMEAKVLAEFKELQTELKHEQEIIKKELERMNPNPLRHIADILLNTTFLVLGDVFWNLSGNVKGVRKKNVVRWLMLLLLFHCYLVLDDSSLKDGCTMSMYDDPWNLKFFDFTDFIKSSRAEFTGRQWLYQEMESVLEGTDARGVFITGTPGSGKSAFLSHLLCSKTSSPVVHSRILAHHFCMHFDKKTQDGVTFVRNLANMIAGKLVEYRQRILGDSFVRRVLYQECSQDSEWCFEHAIVGPLKQFQPQPKALWYIVVDALDECFSDKADVVNILKSKARLLPKWLKLIVSSRNMSSIVASLEGFHRLELRSDSKENLEDIDTYLTLKVFSLTESLVERFKTSFSISDNDAPSQVLVSNLAKKAHGNFLYVKLMLKLWLTSAEKTDWKTFPKSLESTYQLYFERKFSTLESFHSLREILEVLVAAYTPLTIQEMHSLFRLENPTLDLEYDFMPKLDKVSIFLLHGSEGGLRIHHASLSEWLTSDTNKGKVYYVKKKNGHNRLAKYYLKVAAGSMLNPYEAFHLASHVVEGGLDKVLAKQFLSLPSGNINSTENWSQTTALHLSATSCNTNITKLLLQHFFNVDCLDNNERTPSFIAATAGQVGNLLALFDRGANLHHTTAYLDAEIASHSVDPVKECKRRKCGYSLLHTAAQEGNLGVVKFLLQHNISISKTSGSNNTAIQLAAENGHRDTVVMLRNAGGIPDGLSLHHSASNGHTLVVTYLLNEGVKDTCFQGTPRLFPVTVDEEDLNAIKIYVHDNSHLHSRETALHAAVRRGHVSVIEVLLREEQNAISCKNSAGRNPQHEAVYLHKYNSLKALLESGASASIQCNFGISSPLLHHQTIAPETPQEDGCPCGFTPLHFAGKYGYQSVAELLVKYGADLNMGDCNGSTPLHIASCHGMSAILFLLVEKGADINAKSRNGSTPLHSAAACFAKGAFRPLFKLGCNHLAIDNEGMSALHYSVKDANVSGLGYFADWYVNNPKDWIEKAPSRAPNQIMDAMNKTNIQYPWIDSLVELIKTCDVTKDRSISFLWMKDRRNETFFDKLEGKTNASSTFLGTNTRSVFSLVLSLSPVVFALDITLSEAIIKRVTSPLNEPSLTPKPFERVITKTLTSMFTKLNCSALVSAVGHRMVHLVNAMLKAGLNVNCYDSKSGLTPLLVYLRTGGRHMSKVLVKHNVRVEIICGDPFAMSVLHLASYHKLHYLHYVYQFFMGANNWERYLKTDNAIFDYFLDIYEERNNSQGIEETVRIGDGPLTVAILSHPSGTEVIDECFDEEGFNAFHRAAQGANVVAIRKFISWGANYSLESENGFTPLWLSVLYAVKYRPYLNFERVSVLTSLEVELASLTASEILEHGLKNEIFYVGCNESRSDLTLYHVAAIRGMWQFIAHLLSSERVTGIHVNCPNKHGITPMYLAKFMGGDSCEGYGPWCKVVDVIKRYGGTLQYPTLEAEYFLITNVFFGKNPSPLSLELSDDEIMSLREKCGQEECRQYKTSNGDLFRTCDEVDKVHNDYQKKVKKCSDCREECPLEIKTTELPHISFVVFVLGKKLRIKFTFLNVRNNFINFLDNEIARLKDLLHSATRPRAEIPCKNTEHIVDDLCSKFNRIDLETAAHNYYRDYKQSLDLLIEHSDEVKSFMPLQGRLPRVLTKMNFALHNYDSKLNCDWQAIAAKYIQLSFQVRNLNFWRQSVHETLTVPSVSDFVSERMKNVILQSSEESLQLVLKLTSKEPFQEFNYLQILQTRKPPFWYETFDGIGNFR
ncbi:uncharacterized protein [Montipora capricornis]|uniref:uncharacterized protein isoform X2 n=1 Tax=Montipora capricornis TaxID=246305 RepID=UPI0035F1D9A6